MSPKSLRNCFVCVCCAWVAVRGYVAVKVCRKVQVERPRVSTSAGQSGGSSGAVLVGGKADPPKPVVDLLVAAAQEAKEVQLRHLGVEVSPVRVALRRRHSGNLTVFHLLQVQRPLESSWVGDEMEEASPWNRTRPSKI